MNKYVYIIAGIIWVVSKIIEANNKKKKEASAPSPAAPKPIVQDKKPQSAFVPPVKQKTLPVKKKDPKSIFTPVTSQETIFDESANDQEKEGYEAMYSKPIVHETAAQAYKREQAENKTIAPEEEPVQPFEFDARKAIIYSEIMNKPKYSE